MKSKTLLFCFLLCIYSSVHTHAQEPFESTFDIEENTDASQTIATLETLAAELNRQEQELSRLRKRMQTQPDSVDTAQLRKIRESIREQRLLFERFAVDINIAPFTQETTTSFDWQREIGKLLKPIMAEVEFATRQSRIVGELRSHIAAKTTERDLAAEAVANLEKLTNSPVSPQLSEQLEKLNTLWQQRYRSVQDRLSFLEQALNKEQAQQVSPLRASMNYVRTFLRTRGVNLFLGVLAFCIVFIGMRLFAALIRRMIKQKATPGMGSRVATLVGYALGILGGVLAMLMVFSFTADWFLLALAVIFLIGLGWAGFNALPRYVETLRLMLNIGAIREGERLLLDGIPWRVERLGLRAHLVNPRLDGGEQMLALRMLEGKYSRPVGKLEEWFPCSQGDWVELADKKVGQVTYQTPHAVQIIEPGGSRVVYQTPAFLALNPRNMSANLRITSCFGIDYRHLSHCTGSIPQIMKESLQRELPKTVDSANILAITILLKAAASSSLDYEIRVDLAGNAASQFKDVEYRIQSILVDACNEHGWEIPFTQLTIHQK